jgi:lysozyme
MTPARRLQAILAAAACAAGLVVAREGWVTKTAPDPVGIPTACAGVTAGVQPGKRYSDDECVEMTAAALTTHAAEIAPCLPDELPVETRAAFIDLAYNIGAAGFCATGVAARAKAGDLAGACAALTLYDKSRVRSAAWPCPDAPVSRTDRRSQRYVAKDGRRYCIFPGIVARRLAERELCERGLRGGA